MKKVNIVYNPFLLTTVITVDGKKPRENSSLDFNKQRLQEWAEKLPKILLDEYRDKNVSIEFTGTLDDFMDLKEILNANKCLVQFDDFIHHRTPDVEEVEKEVIKIYNDIKQGPVAALKDNNITEAFQEALRSEFAINVVATMSSGKSSLINALLGSYLMPVSEMATTATIVRIIATNQESYSGIAFNSAGEELYREKDLSIEIMKKWNDDSAISSIDIYGPIPCVDNVGMRLVLIDTPGPNNSRDENHKKLTYEMLAESEKSLVLFVMNATQLNIDNEAEFLDYVCKCMKEGGKQSRDRFIFAVNKLDMFQPKNGDKIVVALNSVKEGLDERDIIDPNIFPVTSLTALEIRTDDEDPVAVDIFRRRCSKGDEFHFETYYQYNHLPLPSRSRLSALVKGEHQLDSIELHTGIPSIEEAIRLYVNKYARTIKVKDLVDAFNQRLTELKAEAELLEHIQNNKEEKSRLDSEISKIQKEIESGKSAKEYAYLIDNIDVKDDVKDEMESIVGTLQKRIDDIVKSYNSNTKMPREEALRDVRNVEKDKKDIQSQLEARITKLFEKTFKRTYDQIMEVYKNRLSKLGYQSSDHIFSLNVADFIGQEIYNIDSIVRNSTNRVDEGYDKTVSKSREVWTGGYKINWIWDRKNWGSKRKIMKTEHYTEKVHIPVMVDYVNMRQVVEEFFTPMQVELIQLESEIPAQLEKQATDLKKNLKTELSKVDKLLNKKLQDVKDRMNTSNHTAAQIAEQEKQLEWMRGIITRVNKLIKY